MAEFRVWNLSDMKGGPNKPEPTNTDPQTKGSLWEVWRLVRSENIDVLYSHVLSGTRTGAHIHPDTTHYSSIIEGTALVWMDDRLVELTAGDIIEIPRNVLHNFGAAPDGDVWLVDLTSPPWDPEIMQFRPEADAAIAAAFEAALKKWTP